MIHFSYNSAASDADANVDLDTCVEATRQRNTPFMVRLVLARDRSFSSSNTVRAAVLP
jgi:hypothetical protein